jgi:hypothetical protein
MGRTAFATHGELEALLAERTEGGEVFDKSEIKAKLRELKLEQMRRKGLSTLSRGATPSETTLRNYEKEIATMPGAVTLKKPTALTDSRYTASRSLRSMVADMAVIAATHFDLADEHDAIPRGSNILADLASDALDGAPVRCVKIVTSKDDTTNFAFEGKYGATEKKYIGSSAHSGNKKAHFKVGYDPHFGGTTIRSSFCVSSSGHIADPFIQVCHLTEKELPSETCPSGVLVMEVPGRRG